MNVVIEYRKEKDQLHVLSFGYLSCFQSKKLQKTTRTGVTSVSAVWLKSAAFAYPGVLILTFKNFCLFAYMFFRIVHKEQITITQSISITPFIVSIYTKLQICSLQLLKF